MVDVDPANSTTESAVPPCAVTAEFAARRCGSARSRPSCARQRLPRALWNRTDEAPTSNISNGTAISPLHCVWQEACMRCLPQIAALLQTPQFDLADCELDDVVFSGGGSCPSPGVGSETTCVGCANLRSQELCIGLCTEICKWEDPAQLRGDLCEERFPVIPPEDNTLMYVLYGVGGFVGLIIIFLLVRFAIRMRRKVVEQREIGRLQKKQEDKLKKGQNRELKRGGSQISADGGMDGSKATASQSSSSGGSSEEASGSQESSEEASGSQQQEGTSEEGTEDGGQ